MPAVMVPCVELPPIVAAREVASAARQRLQQRVQEALRAEAKPGEDRLARLFELYRMNALETSAVVQDAVLEVLENGSTNHVSEGEAVKGGLTTGDMKDLELILKSSQERSLVMMGMPTRISASHSSTVGEVTYRGQKTKPAVSGDELSEADLAPPEFSEGEVVGDGEAA